MIPIVDRLLQDVLKDELAKSYPEAARPRVVVSHPASVAVAELPVVSLCLYGIHENTSLRQDFYVTRRPPDKTVLKGRGPLLFDLSYVLSVHAEESTKAHGVLVEALRALLLHPTVKIPSEDREGEEDSLLISVAQPEHDVSAAREWVGTGKAPAPMLTIRVVAPFDPFVRKPVAVVRQTIFGFGQGEEGFLRHPVDARPRSLSATGIVTDAEGKPLEDVLVSVDRRLERTTTDARGRYILLDLPPGRYDLLFKRRDYAETPLPCIVPDTGRLQDVPDERVALGRMDEMEAVSDAKALLGLLRAETVEFRNVVGRLRFPDGRPAAYVPVALGELRTVTDSQGVYSFYEAPIGSTLKADVPGHGLQDVPDHVAPEPPKPNWTSERR